MGIKGTGLLVKPPTNILSKYKAQQYSGAGGTQSITIDAGFPIKKVFFSFVDSQNYGRNIAIGVPDGTGNLVGEFQSTGLSWDMALDKGYGSDMRNVFSSSQELTYFRDMVRGVSSQDYVNWSYHNTWGNSFNALSITVSPSHPTISGTDNNILNFIWGPFASATRQLYVFIFG